MEEEDAGGGPLDLGSSKSFTGSPSPPSWTKLSIDELRSSPRSSSSSPSAAPRSPTAAPSVSEEERKRLRPLKRTTATSPYVLSNFGGNGSSSAKGNSTSSSSTSAEVVISSVIGYALVRLEAHKDKITAAMLDKPLSATDLIELSELKEILAAELKTSGRVPSITMRKDARATMSYASSPLGSSSSGIRQSVRTPPPNTNAFALDPTRLTACEPQVLLYLVREYCRLHIRLFPENIRLALIACLNIPFVNFRLNAMHSLIHALPSGNRTMLQYLASFLSNVLKKSEENGITVDSLALIFGPCLLHSAEDKDHEIEQAIVILREMLEHYDRLFVLCKDMVWKINGDISHMAVAHIERIVEAAIDPNYPEEEIADILFLTYDYHITSKRLLDHFIDLYEQAKGKEDYADEVRSSIIRILDYWVHCYPACFDPAHTFLDRLGEFTLQLVNERSETGDHNQDAISSLHQVVEAKMTLRKEENDSSEDDGGVRGPGKRRGSTLGNHRVSLNPQKKLSSALRALRKSGDKKSKRSSKKEEAKEPADGAPRESVKVKEKKGKSKKAKDKEGTLIMFDGLDNGYKKMASGSTDDSNDSGSSEERNVDANQQQVQSSDAPLAQDENLKRSDKASDEPEGSSTSKSSGPGATGKGHLERSITVSSRSLYAMMGKGFQQMNTQSNDSQLGSSASSTREEGSGSAQPEQKEKRKSKTKGKEGSQRSKRRSDEKEKVRGSSPLQTKRTEDVPSVNGDGSAENSSENGKGESGQEKSSRESPRVKRKVKKSRSNLDSATLSSSMSSSRERVPVKEVRERRGSFMMRTLSLSGSFATSSRTLKEDKDDKKMWRGTVNLSSNHSYSSFAAVPVHSAKEDISFLTAEPGHVARQLTLLDWELFVAIDCDELLQGRFMKPEDSPTFAAMVNRFNRSGQWVCATLLQYDSFTDRAKAIEQFIKIGTECQKIHNFNMLFAIVGGLNTTAISRLKSSWDKLPKKAVRQYKDLMEIASTDANFWHYRSVLKKTPLPLIPYLAICTQDIFKVEEKQTYINGSMIYFDKMRLLWRFNSSFKKWQSTPYSFVTDRGMRAFLNDFTPLSEKEMYDRSYKLEPRSSQS